MYILVLGGPIQGKQQFLHIHYNCSDSVSQRYISDFIVPFTVLLILCEEMTFGNGIGLQDINVGLCDLVLYCQLM